MATKFKSLKASVAYGALVPFIRPKLAMDQAMPNIAKALGTFEPGKFKESIPDFVKALRASLGKKKLAQDADLAGIVAGVEKLMASVEGDKTVEDGDVTDPEDTGLDDTDDTSMDGGPDAIAAYLKSKGVPDDVIAGMPGAKKEEAMDAGKTPEEIEAARLAKGAAKDADTVDEEDGPDGKGKKPDFVSKGAMDAALALNTAATIKRMNGVTAALAKVKPIVGELDMAFDSASGVYRKGFEMLDRDVSKIKELAALEALWDQIPVPGARKQPIAQDSSGADNFATMFPNAAKVRKA